MRIPTYLASTSSIRNLHTDHTANNQDFGHSLIIHWRSSTVRFLEWMPATPGDFFSEATQSEPASRRDHQHHLLSLYPPRSEAHPAGFVMGWKRGSKHFHQLFFEGLRFLKIKETSKWCHYSLLKDICDLDFCHSIWEIWWFYELRLKNQLDFKNPQ